MAAIHPLHADWRMLRILTRLPIAFAPSAGQIYYGCVWTLLFFVCWFLARFLKIDLFFPSFPLLSSLSSPLCVWLTANFWAAFFFPLAWGCSIERVLFFVLFCVFVLIQSFRGDILFPHTACLLFLFFFFVFVFTNDGGVRGSKTMKLHYPRVFIGKKHEEKDKK